MQFFRPAPRVRHFIAVAAGAILLAPAAFLQSQQGAAKLANMTGFANPAGVARTYNTNGDTEGPVLRGLSARAPFFHNGSAQSLLDVVNFYDHRFQIGFTAQEKSDLVAFLSSL